MKRLIFKILIFISIITNPLMASIPDAISKIPELSIHTLPDGTNLLSDAAGLTLYTFDVDEPGVSKCFNSCLAIWPAILTSANKLPAPFSIHVRANGDKQVVLNDMPLYYFASDRNPGETFGDGLQGVWHIVQLEANMPILRDVISTIKDLSFHTLPNGIDLLTDASGLTLYTFDVDEHGVSKCFDSCLAIWPALLTTANALPAPFSIHTRANGDKQIVLNNMPLYFYFNDNSPGDSLGDGLQGVWHIVQLEAKKLELRDVISSIKELAIHSIPYGKDLLSDATGLTLYSFDIDEPGLSKCSNSCITIWPPLLTKENNLPEPFSIHVRTNGDKQIVFNDMPLYYYINDKAPGHTFGDELQGVWHIVEIKK